MFRFIADVATAVEVKLHLSYRSFKTVKIYLDTFQLSLGLH